MNKQFRRGKQLLTLVIAIVLVTDGLRFWLSRSLLLSWYHEATAQVYAPDPHAAQRLLEYFVEIDQRNFLVDQGIIYALLILCLVILYLGYSWVRWLWGMVWLAKGISGLLVAYLLIRQFAVDTNLIFFGLATSALYVVCALCILCLPSVNVYLRTMRR